MSPRFEGFPAEGLQFLKALKRNNRREWFQKRKEIYDTKVKEPMVALVDALNADLAKHAPEYITDPKRAIFRIYRDTRFAHDKTPYKTHVAAAFGTRGMSGHTGGMLYFHVSPEVVEIAGGIYHPDPPSLRRVREHLCEHHGELREIVANRRLRQAMGEVRGDTLTRVPKGFAADHPAAEWIKMKDWIFDVELDNAVATTPKLFEEVRVRFRLMMPFVRFLNRAFGVERGPLVRAEDLF